MKANDLVIFALRSPLYRFMGDTILITVTGRKSGRKITLPVNYLCEGNSLWIVSSRDRKWWRNLRGSAPVDIHIHGRDFHGTGEAVLDERLVAARLKDYVCQMPAAARFLNISMEHGIPNCDDVSRAARERLFVHICLE